MHLLRLSPLLLFSFAFVGCGVFSDASPTPTPTSTPTATPTSTPSPTPTPTPELLTPSVQIPQGDVGVIEVNARAASAMASFDGRNYTMLAKEGGFWAVIGVGAAQPLGAYPVVVALRAEDGTDLDRLDATISVVETAYPFESITLAPDQSALLDPALSQQEAAMREALYSRHTAEQRWSGVFLQPLPGPISSPYGVGRSYNGGPVTSFHHGTDFGLDEGTPVAAANTGRVAFADEMPIRGLSVVLDHGGGVFTAYHHLSGAAVVAGQLVAIGDLVGFVGASGLATGPHLHWELIVNGVEVDPMLWTLGLVGPTG